MNELPNLIDYSTSDFVMWQEEREAMRQEIERLTEALIACQYIIDSMNAD